MSTTTARVPVMVVLPRAVQWGLEVIRAAPVIPVLILTVLGFAAVFAPVLAPHDQLQPVTPTAAQCQARYGFPDCPYVDGMPPFWYAQGSLHTPLGTDYLGRDILSRLMYGARISLVVGITGALVAGVIGTLLGIVAGYMGKWWDQIIMRITDAWLTLPSLVFAILLSSIRGPGLWNVVLILALVFWSRYTRVVRGEVLSLREREFVKLAEVNGVSRLAIILKHLLPNVMNTVMVVFSLQVGISIIIEASLSFLGVGVPPPEPSWGLMMAQERESLMEGKWWLATFPGTCIMLLVLAANLMGDWLRVHLDPQLRNR
jgi:peptide/nickel transport system permease protein